MKNRTYISLFLLCSCAADPFTAGLQIENVDAGNNIDANEAGEETSDTLVQNKDSGTTDQQNVIADAGVDQNNFRDQIVISEKDINVEVLVDAQTPDVVEESHDIGPCIPKTCLTLSVEADRVAACGLHFDGCGNYIQCPNCDIASNAHSSCGGDDVSPEGVITPGTIGYCGGECVHSSLSADTSRCTITSNKYIFPWVCSDTSINQPKGFGPSACVNLKNHEVYPFVTPTNKWCCSG